MMIRARRFVELFFDLLSLFLLADGSGLGSRERGCSASFRFAVLKLCPPFQERV